MNQNTIQDSEDAALLLSLDEALEKGELKTVSSFEVRKKKWEKSAQSHLRKNQRVNVRLPDEDIYELKNISKIENIPYQTLIGSFVHLGIQQRKQFHQAVYQG